jgi:DNA-3-methyladenine glycosylase II
MPRPQSPHAKAERHLARVSPPLEALIGRVGPCTLSPMPDPYRVLVRTIVSQQLGTKAAESISARLEALLGKAGYTPKRFAKITDTDLRACGLSGAKVKSIRDLTARIDSGELPIDAMDTLSDDEVATKLRQVHGIGPWSVDMFLIFCLGRPDVLPVGDFGLRAAVRDMFTMSDLPSVADLQTLAEPWRPFRTIATWYCWRYRDGQG